MANPVKPLVWCCGYTYPAGPPSLLLTLKCRACGEPISKAAEKAAGEASGQPQRVGWLD